ncbi:MAG: hypothetical protein JSW39_00705, partial [Desulfobacterales bacterium]
MNTTDRLSRFYLVLLTTAVFVLSSTVVQAAGELHKRPFDFLFGNHIDTHQQTLLKTRGGNPTRLSGFFYIIFTGEIDPVSGLRVARHPRGAGQGEECGIDDIDCVVRWIMSGKPGAAKFLYHNGVNGEDHPVWMLNRTQIPQPGSFTHFHWITPTSDDPRAAEVPKACDKMNAADLENQ